MRLMAGPNAVDCGSTKDANGYMQTNQREADAYRAGKAFFSRDDNTEPPGSMGTVFTSRGEIFYLFLPRASSGSTRRMYTMKGMEPKSLSSQL